MLISSSFLYQRGDQSSFGILLSVWSAGKSTSWSLGFPGGMGEPEKATESGVGGHPLPLVITVQEKPTVSFKNQYQVDAYSCRHHPSKTMQSPVTYLYVAGADVDMFSVTVYLTLSDPFGHNVQ